MLLYVSQGGVEGLPLLC